MADDRNLVAAALLSGDAHARAITGKAGVTKSNDGVFKGVLQMSITSFEVLEDHSRGTMAGLMVPHVRGTVSSVKAAGLPADLLGFVVGGKGSVSSGCDVDAYYDCTDSAESARIYSHGVYLDGFADLCRRLEGAKIAIPCEFELVRVSDPASERTYNVLNLHDVAQTRLTKDSISPEAMAAIGMPPLGWSVDDLVPMHPSAPLVAKPVEIADDHGYDMNSEYAKEAGRRMVFDEDAASVFDEDEEVKEVAEKAKEATEAESQAEAPQAPSNDEAAAAALEHAIGSDASLQSRYEPKKPEEPKPDEAEAADDGQDMADIEKSVEDMGLDSLFDDSEDGYDEDDRKLTERTALAERAVDEKVAEEKSAQDELDRLMKDSSEDVVERTSDHAGAEL